MKKWIKKGMLVSLLFAVTLGFASTNNFGWNFVNWGNEDAREVPAEEIKKRITEEVVGPVSQLLDKQQPNLHMTKCYVRYTFDVYGIEADGLEKSDRKFYDYERLNGSVILDHCGSKDQVCKYKYNLGNSEFYVRESVFTDWMTIEEFKKQIEAREKTILE